MTEYRLVPIYTDMDRRQVLEKYLQRHEELISSLMAPKDPETEDRIALGYVSLLREVLQTPSPNSWGYFRVPQLAGHYLDEIKLAVVASPIYVFDIEQVVQAAFMRCVANEPVSLQMDPKHLDWGDFILKPLDVETIILCYGLVDGIRRTNTQISREQKSKGDPNWHLIRGISVLRANLLDMGFIRPILRIES